MEYDCHYDRHSAGAMGVNKGLTWVVPMVSLKLKLAAEKTWKAKGANVT